jgi:hypothetical protein
MILGRHMIPYLRINTRDVGVRRSILLLGVILVAVICMGANLPPADLPGASQPVGASPRALLSLKFFLPVINSNMVGTGAYVLLGWNDLGMHCYNRNFQDIAVLPPYNNLWAQVIRRGDPPVIVTQGIRVQYSFPDNTISSTKSNFWQYAPKLFNVNLPDNVGLKGKGMAGVMDPQTGYFVAEGIPLTEFSDSAPTTPAPYQQAKIIAKDNLTGATLASLTVVAPVSTEMHCDFCHATGQDPGGNQPRTELNILALHDREEGTTLLSQTPVLCANCHASNALGMVGNPSLPNLSRAMHSHHSGEVPNTLNGCYSCHPGPTTQCLRDVMSQTVTSALDPTRKMNCIDCHGTMQQVSQNTNPWLIEPRCDTCHVATTTHQYNQDQPLYRHSVGHGGVYCEACHDSTHAIAPSRELADAIKFNQLQGHGGPVDTCTVCHLTLPTGKGPHVK